MLLHIVDGADPHRDERVEQVQAVLAEIGADEVPQLVVMNKVDLLSPQQVEALGNTPVSAVTGQGVAELMDRIERHWCCCAAGCCCASRWQKSSVAVSVGAVLDDNADRWERAAYSTGGRQVVGSNASEAGAGENISSALG